MGLTGRIEMSACALGVGGAAIALLVNVKAVHSGRSPLTFAVDGNVRAILHETDGSRHGLPAVGAAASRSARASWR